MIVSLNAQRARPNKFGRGTHRPKPINRGPQSSFTIETQRKTNPQITQNNVDYRDDKLGEAELPGYVFPGRSPGSGAGAGSGNEK